MTPKIYVLVGMIASCKSTYCSNAAKSGQVVINDDNIVNMIHADNYTLYDKGLKILYKTLENTAISLGISLGRSVVVDRGVNISKKGRRRWLALAGSFDVACEAIVFPKDKPEVHAKRRFESSSRGRPYHYWLDVANEHAKQWEDPTHVEGFNKVHYIQFTDVTCGLVIQG